MRSGLTSSSRQQQTLNFTIGPVGASATNLTLGLYYTGNISVTWNPGITSTYSSSTNTKNQFINTYVSTGATGTIRGNVNLIRRIASSSSGDMALNVPAIETSKLHSLAEFSAESTQSWQFDMGALPSMMTTMGNGGLNTSFGSIGSSAGTNLPSGLTYFSVGGLNTMTGNISNLPVGLTTFAVSTVVGYTSVFNLTGNINSLPPNIVTFTIQGNLSTISGDIANLISKTSLTFFTVYGANTIDGDIVNIPSNVQTFNVRGYNTIYGNIANIPASVTHFYLSGNNYVSGDISTLKPTLVTLYLTEGFNTITGNLNTMNCPSMNTFSVYGRNQISGDIVDLPATVSNFNMYGYNTINGTTANIKPAMRNFFWRGFGTMTGNINAIPSGLTQFSVSVLTSNIYPGPSAGTNTVFGNIADVPNSVTWFAMHSGTVALTYTGKTWPTMSYFYIFPKPGFGLTQSQVDALLIDFAAANWNGNKQIYLAGYNAAPSYTDPAVSAAITTLTVTKGVSVTLTP